MTTMPATHARTARAADAPGSGGAPLVPRRYLRLEILRALRNPWTIGFAVVMPVAMYLLFGAAPEYGQIATPRGTVAGIVMANMALFGAITAAVNVAGSVADERGSGWNRQLRLTPLVPWVYVAAKLLAALATALIVVVTVFAVGLATGAKLVLPALVGAFWFAWVAGTVMFGAFGLAVGYLFRNEAVLGVVGPLLSLFAFFGGMFIPLDGMGDIRLLAPFTPMYGLRSLLESITAGESVETAAVLGVAGWTALFVTVAAWRYRSVAGRE